MIWIRSERIYDICINYLRHEDNFYECNIKRIKLQILTLLLYTYNYIAYNYNYDLTGKYIEFAFLSRNT